MQDLQELFERKLASMVPEHQWEEFETHIQMLLERWARAQDAVLFANMVRAWPLPLRASRAPLATHVPPPPLSLR